MASRCPPGVRDVCGHGRVCDGSGACVDAPGSVPVGHPCRTSTDCGTWACRPLAGAVARDAGFPVGFVPSVCVSNAEMTSHVTDFQRG